MLEALVKEAFQNGASDLHLSTGLPPIFRLHGQLKAWNDTPLEASQLEKMVQTVLDDKSWQLFQKHGEADTSFELKDVCRLRINVFKKRGEIAMACRLIPLQPPSIDQLNLPKIIKQLANLPQGLVLVTGPTGSGKSTTLAAMIQYINEHQAKHIVTLEDPIEYIYASKKSLIHQREVGTDTPSFVQGLRAALRQDPDVILVGEMRDLETIGTALTAAETGHLVLATLHTPDAPQSVERIIDVFPSGQKEQIRIQLSGVLAAVIAQRLLPRSDGKGRIACFEILINTPAVANLIRSSKGHQIRAVMETSRQVGMQTMEQALRELVAQNLVNQKDVPLSLGQQLT